jgi:hypothetical protein
MRALAVAHGAWGALVLVLAVWWAREVFQILPHLKVGTARENLTAVTMLALVQCGPLAALGFWMLALGRAIRRGDPGLRRRLRRAHGLLLVVALAAMLVGVSALQAAQRSAQRGGGLLGWLGLIPLVLGGFVGLLSAGALGAAWYGLPPAKSP